MFEEVEQIIETIMQNSWHDTPVYFDNVLLKQSMETPYVTCKIDWLDAYGAGPMRTRNDGYILLEVFVPQNIGSRLATKLIDKLNDIFKSSGTGNLHFKPGQPQRIGNNNGWYQRNLNVPFYFDYCKEVLP